MKVQIPEPCHEDWSKMKPQEQGRFCGSCQKLVIDFSQMSDKEIVGYFKESKSKNTCGYFKKSQVDRKLKQPAAPTPIRKFFLKELAVAVFTFFVASNEAKAQGGTYFSEEEIEQSKNNSDTIRKNIIKGKIINGEKNLVNATISIKGTDYKTVSLENGFFSITIPSEIAQNKDNIILIVKYKGLADKEIKVKTSLTNHFLKVDFSEKHITSNEELINALSGQAGGIQIVEDVITVTGNVSSVDGALPGTTIWIKGTTQGTQTDIDGNYTLVAPQKATLVFRFVGYDTQEITLEINQKNVDVKLKEDESLSEVVVAGGACAYNYRWYTPRNLWYSFKNLFRK
ncbi:carboxypeptidase-like regulatory domain-containing protein [Bernardetia sp. ABR2-2B]|uniref:carboxypeptidase-like regulatory domain-containing protein n=1 Tax=Bernardetia sp. ABR2-2B TaxID=3127472 RepID=UPI0030CE0D73